LLASQGENRDMIIRNQYWDDHYTTREEDWLIPYDERTRKMPMELFNDREIPAEHMRVAVHWPAAPAGISVNIGGNTGDQVTINTPRDAQRAAEEAAWRARIKPKSEPASDAADDAGVTAADDPNGSVIEGLPLSRGRPIP
ncbi:MAG: hypothetical protein AAF556_11980, partial [Pseudomonadota bacterium]